MAGAGLLLAGCGGPLSTLDPAGPSAASIARIWWVMLAGAAVILAFVLVLLAVVFLSPDRLRGVPGRVWIVGLGLAFPLVTLTALVTYALLTGERLIADPAERDVVTVRAVARQWEWRFGPPDGPLTAGRLVIPAGRPVHVAVTSEDVIHSFWVPRLAGKMDAIPGHVNVIRIVAPAPGVYHGACAEFCGLGHAAMPFVVEAVDPAGFNAAGLTEARP